jgi:hypothetical protein
MATGIAVAPLGFLALRVIALDHRVDDLTQRLGASARSSAPEREHVGAPAPAARADYAQRLARLEQRLNLLTPATSQTEAATHVDEAQILAVVARENDRVREVQLEYHRSRWSENRRLQLEAFAQASGLTSLQTSQLRTILEREANALFEQLRKPNLLEDPDQTAGDVQAALDSADTQALRILTPPQRELWTQARTLERKALWPWLPQAAQSLAAFPDRTAGAR